MKLNSERLICRTFNGGNKVSDNKIMVKGKEYREDYVAEAISLMEAEEQMEKLREEQKWRTEALRKKYECEDCEYSKREEFHLCGNMGCSFWKEWGKIIEEVYK